jgi:transketolase
MRDAFCRELIRHSARSDFVFLTGDLGFKALEPLRAAMTDRFINAGVAEQNMVCVAAGLASTGFRPWVYSIALTGLPVALAGNGGGYGYGVMGATHHALEDYGVLLTLANLRAFIPAFDSDLPPIIDIQMTATYPSYLRLGVAELPDGFELPAYAAWRHLIQGDGATLLVTGPIVGGIIREVRKMAYADRPSVWLVSELPLRQVPSAFLEDVQRSQHLSVVEEHVKNGGLGQMISHHLMALSVTVRRFTHHYAQGYLSGLYGSQNYHRRESQLDPSTVLAALAAVAT